jgi:hypothetical protein
MKETVVESAFGVLEDTICAFIKTASILTIPFSWR